MKVENLSIQREPTYGGEIKPLEGNVQLSGSNGKMEVKLSNKTVSDIFALVRRDVERVAATNAALAGHAIEQAENEMPLISADVFTNENENGAGYVGS